MDTVVGKLLDAAVAEGFLTPGAARDGLLHSAGFLAGPEPPVLAANDLAVDLGTGGGLPGLVLAASTACRWRLVDRSRRRCAFLAGAVRALGLAERVEVVEADAADLGRGDLRGAASLVTARGFGRPAVTVECATPLLRAGGRLVVSEPPSVHGQRWDEATVRDLGIVRTAEWTAEGATFRGLWASGRCPDRYPRTSRAMERAPLF